MKFKPCACRAEHYGRVPRSPWMRLVPTRRLYHCLSCDQMLFIRPDDAIGSPFKDTVLEPREARPEGRRRSAA